jgi:hypothetical protein
MIASDGAYTTLVADLDQAALYGALLRIQALALDLIELTRTSETQADRRRPARGLPDVHELDNSGDRPP